jgi:hypothetical protein
MANQHELCALQIQFVRTVWHMELELLSFLGIVMASRSRSALDLVPNQVLVNIHHTYILNLFDFRFRFELHE